MDLKNQIKSVKKLAYLCYECTTCNTVCPTSLVGIFSPTQFVQKVIDLENLESIIAEEELFNCLTCGLCSIHCPMSVNDEGINFPQIIRELRTYGYENKLTAEQMDKNSTHDNIMLLHPTLQSQSDKWGHEISFLTGDTELKVSDNGPIAYFPGCMNVMESKFKDFGYDYKNINKETIRLLNLVGIEPVLVQSKCCGHDNYWVGDKDTTIRLAEYNIQQYKDAGVETIIFSCAEGYNMWKTEYPKIIPNFSNYNFKIKHITEFLIENNKISALLNGSQSNKLQLKTNLVTVTYHDPCRLGRLSGVYEEPREILKLLPGVELVEMEENRQDSICCGISNFVGCNSGTRKIRERRLKQAAATEAEYLVTTCPKCITHFSCYYNDHYDLDSKHPPERIPEMKIMEFGNFIAERLGISTVKTNSLKKTNKNTFTGDN